MKQKNKTRLARAAMTLLLALLTTFGAWAQTTVEIGDGTSTGYYTPIGTYYNYSITEQLYTANEIGMAGTISSISFYYAATAAKDFPITVYMANVDAEDLSTGISLASADQVFEGTLSVTGAGWVTIDFDTPFAYDGTSNLLIGINKGYVYWFSGNPWQYTSVANMARYSQNDNDPYDTTTVPGTVTNNRPNIQIAITADSGPVCDKPETLVASNVTANSATLTWSGGSGTYNVEYKKNSDTEWTSLLTNTTATTTTLSGLTPGTSYQARVQSVCEGDDVSGWKYVAFSTQFGIPLVEEFGTSIPTGWAQYTGLLDKVMLNPEDENHQDLASTTNLWYFGTANGVFDNHARVNIYGTSCNKWLVMPSLLMEDNVQLSFDLALTAYSGTLGAPETTGTDDKFVVLISTDNMATWTILRQWDNAGSENVYNNIANSAMGQTVTIDLSSYAGQNIAIAFYGESTETNADNNLHIDNVSIDYIPACPKPTNLTVNYTGGTTVDVSWTANGDADAWNVAVIDEEDNYKVTRVYTNPSTTITGLELGTTYRVEVATFCGENNVSDWTTPVSFTTDLCMPEDQCEITFELTDDFGDGWNGASIKVVDVLSNKVLGQFTNTNAADAGVAQNYTLAVCPDRDIQFVWVSGSYDSECSYVVKDVNGSEIFSGSGAMSASLNYTVDCTARMTTPTELTISEIGPHSAKLSWTENGDATEWMVCKVDDDESFVGEAVIVTEKTYTLTNLDPETKYNVKVCAVSKTNGIENSLWSEKVTFTTDIANPAPTDLAVSHIGPTNATATWQSFADSYEVRYAPMPETGVGEGWLRYDDGEYATSIGSQSTNTQTWGVMYPGSQVTGSKLTKVSYYNKGYNTSTITVKIYSGVETPSDTPLYSEDVTPTNGEGFQEITLASPAAIKPGENLWITFTEEGTFVKTACISTEPNNQWVLNSNEWVSLASLNYSLAGYGWMIRGYFESETTDVSWNNATTVEKSYDITGLTPETKYVVQVRGDFGNDGMSEWTTTAFTTTVSNPVPTDLDIDLAAGEGNGGTITWTGYGDSYNVRYRKAESSEIVFFDDFENGLNRWTIAHADDATAPSSGYWYTINPTSGLSFEAHSGTQVASSWSWNSSAYNADNWLITPQLALGNTLKFWVRTSSGYPDSYEVLLSTTGNTINTYTYSEADTDHENPIYASGDFTVTLQEMAPAPNTGKWEEVTIDLSSYKDQQGYIAIHHKDYDANYLVIDDFGIYGTTTPAGDWTLVTSEEESVTLAGLPGGGYEYQVQSVKGQNTSEWSETGEFALLIFGDTGSHLSKMLNNLGRKAYVRLNNRMLAAGNQWNTLCLPFDLPLEGSVLEGATVKTLDDATVTGDHISLTFSNPVDKIEAGVPYIVKVGSAIANPAFANVVISSTSGQTLTVDPQVKFVGYYDAFQIDNTDTDIYYMTAGNVLDFYTGTDPRTLYPFRAYFQFTGFSSAPEFSLDFGDDTTVISRPQLTTEDGEWYTLQGMKVGKKPTTAGVYIHNGKKVIIK